MTLAPLDSYDRLIESGQILSDPQQTRVIRALQQLYTDLCDPRKEIRAIASDNSIMAWFRKRRESTHIKSLYIHGSVGRGKTMLMDLFFESVADVSKRRVHFHTFMYEVHHLLNIERAKKEFAKIKKRRDPIDIIANYLVQKSTVICLDEFQVTNIADAMILGRLFEKLIANRAVIILTSNEPPENLYANGLNRERFIPFISLIKQKMNVISLDGLRDYRKERLIGQPVFYSPLDLRTDQALKVAFSRLTDELHPKESEAILNGRRLKLKGDAKGVLFALFSQLCGQPLGAQDYIRMASSWHTIVLARIPTPHEDYKEDFIRFIHFVDIWYEHKHILILSSEVPISLWSTAALGIGTPFQRMLSRLEEMSSQGYLEHAMQLSHVYTDLEDLQNDDPS